MKNYITPREVVRMIFKIDDFIIDKVFQQFANLFQKVFGKNCFWLAKLFFFSAIFSQFGIILVRGLDNKLGSAKGILIAINLLICFMCLQMVNMVSLTEAIIHHMRNVANPWRYHPLYKFMRVVIFSSFMLSNFSEFLSVVFAVGSVNILSVLGIFFSIFLICGMYFKACAPLPPQKSWLAKLAEKFKEIFSGSVSPAPVPVGR